MNSETNLQQQCQIQSQDRNHKRNMLHYETHNRKLIFYLIVTDCIPQNKDCLQPCGILMIITSLTRGEKRSMREAQSGNAVGIYQGSVTIKACIHMNHMAVDHFSTEVLYQLVFPTRSFRNKQSTKAYYKSFRPLSLQLMGSFVLAVGLWLRFDPETVSLLNGDKAPDTFFIGEYHSTPPAMYTQCTCGTIYCVTFNTRPLI